MPNSLPDLTKDLQNTKTFFNANNASLDAAINAINQNTQQAKTLVLERTNQSIDNLNQILNHTLNQTLSEGVQASINSSLESWINNYPPLIWIINHPLLVLEIFLLGLFLFSGLLGAISSITEKFWMFILISPFKLISSGWRIISKSFQHSNEPQKNIDAEAEDRKRIALLLKRLEANRQEQSLLLQELESLHKL